MNAAVSRIPQESSKVHCTVTDFEEISSRNVYVWIFWEFSRADYFECVVSARDSNCYHASDDEQDKNIQII